MTTVKWVLKELKAGKKLDDLPEEAQQAYNDYLLEKQSVLSIRKKRDEGKALTMWEKAVLRRFAGLGSKKKEDDKRSANGRKLELDAVNPKDWTSSDPSVVLTLNRFFELIQKGSTQRMACHGAGLNVVTVQRWLGQGEDDEGKEIDSTHAWFFRTFKACESYAMERHLDIINRTDKADLSLKWLQTRFKDEVKDESTVNVKSEIAVDDATLDRILQNYADTNK